MNRRGFIGAITGAAAAIGLTRKAEPAAPPAQEFALLRRNVQHFEIKSSTPAVGLFDDTGARGKCHWFTAPVGVYEAFDLESPTTGDPSRVRGSGIKADGTRVVFTPKDF